MDPANVISKKAGRPPRYDWTDKRDLCYKLFVEEQRSVREIIDYFLHTLGVSEEDVPSARNFNRQFARWEFPERRPRLAPEDKDKLVQRIRELWQANYTQKQMLDTLAQEGCIIDELKLARLRRKHGIMLRVAAGYNEENMGPGTGRKRKAAALTDDQPVNSIDNYIQDDGAAQTDRLDGNDVDQVVDENALPPEVAAQRLQRLLDIQANSDSALQSKKRRRRIRGLAHLPPDEAGLPPRYKSETSLDECKAFLSLSNEMYKEVRSNFESICVEKGIIKKRLCETGAWQAAKDRLVRESTHLSAVLNPVHENLEQRDNALEVICADVTKRMRTHQKQIYLKDANNILGLNPEQSKQLRRQFYEILKADHFQSMLLCGKEHWEELKQRWLAQSSLAQQTYSSVTTEEQKRSIDVLLRDAMKRHNEDNVSKQAHLVQPVNTSYGPGPGPARRGKQNEDESQVNIEHTFRQPVQQMQNHHRHVDIDPLLLASLAAGQVDGSMNQDAPASYASSIPVTRGSTPAYFRLASDSQTTINHPKVWLASLSALNMAELHRAATSKAAPSKVVKAYGILRGHDGQEDHFAIDSDDELEAYFAAVQDQSNAKVSFLVQLQTSGVLQ